MRSAFSLVELSIVLVILGLLTGGILAGQSLIRAAELRSVSTEHQRYIAAAHAFRDKYFALPGDMNNATRFWGAAHATPATCITTVSTTALTCDGNANGKVGLGVSEEYERARFWQHMANAGLIEGTFTGVETIPNQPGVNLPRSRLSQTGWFIDWITSPFAGTTWSFIGNYDNTLIFGGPDSANKQLSTPALKPEELWNIDTKMDDGQPAIGKVRAYRWATCTNAASESDVTTTYRLSSTSIGCAAYFTNIF